MVIELIGVALLIVAIIGIIKMGGININVTIKQELNAEDHKLLEDIYNEKGDVRDTNVEYQEYIDDAIQKVNAIMYGVEEQKDDEQRK